MVKPLAGAPHLFLLHSQRLAGDAVGDETLREIYALMIGPTSTMFSTRIVFIRTAEGKKNVCARRFQRQSAS